MICRLVTRRIAPITPAIFAQLLELKRPNLVVVDTLSQLGSDNGIKPNDAESVAPFMKKLLDAVQARPDCGAIFIHIPRITLFARWEVSHGQRSATPT